MEVDSSNEALNKQIRALQDENKRLRQDKETYTEIFRLTPDLLCVADIATLKFLKINPAFTSLLGFTEEELLSCSFLDLIHPEDIESTIDIVNEKLKIGERVLNFTNRYRCSDGSYCWLEWISHPMPERGITFASAHDITKRKALETSLRKNEDIIKTVLDNLPIGVAVNSTDPSGNFEYINNNYTKYYRTTEDAIADTDGFWSSIYEDPVFREKIKARISKDSATGDPSQMVWEDIPITRKGEKTTYVTVRNTPIVEKGLMVSTVWDVTHRKKIEQELKESEERYKMLHNASIGGIFIHDQGIVLDCNQGLADMTGYNFDELIGMDALNTLVATDWRGIVSRNIASGHDQPYEAEGVRKDGTIFPLYISGKNVPYKGRIVRAVEYRDLTEKKMAEKTLHQSYIQLKTIYNALPVIIWSLDEKGIFTLSEGKELNNQGFESGQLVGRSVFDVYKENPQLLEGIKEALDGNFYEYESDLNGAFYHIVLNPSFDKENRVCGLNGIAFNITEKRETEAEIRRLRNYLSNIINSMPSLIVGVDPKGAITQWNKMAEKTTGISAEEARSKTISEVLPQMAFAKDKILRSIRTRQIIHEEKKPVKKQNEICYEDITIYPLIANGVEGAVVRIDDVSNKVRLEEMIVQNEKMLSVGGLAAGMAHEINNPLAGIIQTAHVIKSRLENLQMPSNLALAEEIGVSLSHINAFMEKRNILKMIESINVSGRRLAEIVDNMLSFARKAETSISSHNPAKLMDQILEIASTDYNLKKQYDFKNIQIIKEYDKGLPMLPCEGPKIQQVLLNILQNGSHAMQANRSEKNEAPRFIIRISTEKETKMLKMEIEDNGPGMDEKTLKRIFEPFFTTKPPGIGTGLGLSVSYFIITENHGGTMDARSIPGQGSTFTIRLPLVQKRKK